MGLSDESITNSTRVGKSSGPFLLIQVRKSLVIRRDKVLKRGIKLSGIALERKRNGVAEDPWMVKVRPGTTSFTTLLA